MAGAGGHEVGRISIRVVPDTDRFRAELRKDLAGIEKEFKATIPVDLDLDAAGAKAHLRAILAEMKALGTKGVDVKVGVDKTLGARVNEFARLGRIGASLAPAARNMQKFGEGASIFGQGPNLTWATLFLAIGALGAPAVGLVSGLLAGLPSLFAAAAAGAGAVVLGLEGIKKAADDSGWLSAGKKGKQGPGEVLKQLQSSVSQVFQSGLTPVFEKLTTLLPVLQQGFGGVAQGMVNMAKGVTDIITSSGGMAQIKTIFQGIGNLFTGLTPAFQAFTQTFLTLGAEGAKNFGFLIAPIQQFAQSFDQMIGRVANNGVLQGAFQGLSQTLGSLLGLFTKLFESGLGAMAQLGGPLSTFVDGVGNALVALMPALTTFSSLVGNVLGALGNAVAPAIQAITPAFTELANVLGGLITSNLTALSPILTQVASAIGTGLTTALAQIEPLLPSLLSSFQQLANVFAGQLAAYLPQIAVAFGQLAGVAITNLPLVMQQLANAFVMLAPELPTLIPAITQIASALGEMAVAIGPALPQLIGLAVAVIQVTAAFAGGVLGALQEFKGAIDNAGNTVAGFANIVSAKISEVVTYFTTLPGKIVSALAGLGEALFSAGAHAVQRLVDGIKSIDVVGAVGSVLGGVLNLIPHSPAKEGPFSASGWTSLFTGGQAIGNQFNDGLKDGFQGVIQSATQLLGELQTAVSQGVVTPDLKNNLKDELKAIAVEYDQLKVARDAATDPAQKKSISEQMKQLQTLRDQLDLQRDQVGYTDQQAKGQQDITQQLGQQFKKGIDIVSNFGMANVKQFESDLGISGNGAIPTIADSLLSWGTGMLGNLLGGMFGGQGGGVQIHVNSVDDALAARQNIINKQALGIAGR